MLLFLFFDKTGQVSCKRTAYWDNNMIYPHQSLQIPNKRIKGCIFLFYFIFVGLKKRLTGSFICVNNYDRERYNGIKLYNLNLSINENPRLHQ
jgi:hypothetical protein